MKKIIFFLILMFFVFPDFSYAQLRTNSNTITTKVGNPLGGLTGSGWPVASRSRIEQGIAGAFDHVRLYNQGLQSIDLSNVVGTPITTTFDGTVKTVCNDAQTSCGTYTGCNSNGCGYGKHVVIESNIGGKTATVFFGHLSQIKVTQGQPVKKGDQIGLMGTTGFSTGPHLHWEFRGIPMAPPNIPTAITPLDCDYPDNACTPGFLPTQ